MKTSNESFSSDDPSLIDNNLNSTEKLGDDLDPTPPRSFLRQMVEARQWSTRYICLSDQMEALQEQFASREVCEGNAEMTCAPETLSGMNFECLHNCWIVHGDSATPQGTYREIRSTPNNCPEGTSACLGSMNECAQAQTMPFGRTGLDDNGSIPINFPHPIQLHRGRSLCEVLNPMCMPLGSVWWWDKRVWEFNLLETAHRYSLERPIQPKVTRYRKRPGKANGIDAPECGPNLGGSGKKRPRKKSSTSNQI